MDNKVKKFQKAFLIFTIAQFFMVLGLFGNVTSIKALSNWLFLFGFCKLIGGILMIVASSMLYQYNKNYFYFFVTTIIDMFIFIICMIGEESTEDVTVAFSRGEESTEDVTVAFSRGLSITADILLGIVYIYFFLGTRDYFKEEELIESNSKKSKIGFIIIIVLMIVINLLSFIKTFDVVKTNLIATAIFKYGAFITKLVMYVFIFVVLVLMMINLQKKRKEITNNEKEQ